MLPFEPESIKALKARGDEALEHLFYTSEADTRQPDLLRTHVFDFEDGLRIVASWEHNKRDKFEDPMIHFYASFEGLSAAKPRHYMTTIKRHIMSVFRYPVVKPTNVSEKGVLHFAVPRIYEIWPDAIVTRSGMIIFPY